MSCSVSKFCATLSLSFHFNRNLNLESYCFTGEGEEEIVKCVSTVNPVNNGLV